MKNLSAMQDTWVRSLGGEDLLKKEVATHSSIPAWKIPCTEEPGRLQSMGSQSVRQETERLSLSLWIKAIFACFHYSLFAKEIFQKASILSRDILFDFTSGLDRGFSKAGL